MKLPTFFDHAKRNLSLLAVCALLLALPEQVALAGAIPVYINDALLAADTPPQLVNERAYLPLRACAEALDADVAYDNKLKAISITRGDVDIELTVGSTLAIVNGQARPLDAEALLINDRAMVPVRFVSENLSCEVNWDQMTGAIYIYTAGGGNDGDNADNVLPMTPVGPDTTDTERKPADETNAKLVELPQMSSIVKDAMQQINNVRQYKELESFLTTEELIAMAQAHAEDMAQNGFFGSASPGLGGPGARAEAYGLPAASELIAKVDYAQSNVVAAVTAWLNKEPSRSLLLDPSAGYIGIAAYNRPNTNEVYLVAEVLPTRAFFTDAAAHSTTTEPELTLSGRSAGRRESVTVYRLSDSNPAMYTEKRTVQANVANSYFFVNLRLWDKGEYAVTVANHTIYVTYN